LVHVAEALEPDAAPTDGRLVEWRERVAREKRAAFRDQDYWGVPFLGSATRPLILGLAPAAHGGSQYYIGAARPPAPDAPRMPAAFRAAAVDWSGSSSVARPLAT
jgi:hypothetical protein